MPRVEAHADPLPPRKGLQHRERQPALLGARGFALLSGLGAATLSFAVFGSRGLAQLYTRHPYEDAFIVFRYAEHTGRGLGIVFNPAGPATEGATDFLWMLCLAGLSRLGLDVAVAAVLLNAFGTGLLAWLFHRMLVRQSRPAGVAHGVAWLLALGLPFVAGAHASYEGFSAQLYCALCVGCFCLYLDGTVRGGRFLPYAALVLALFRPDGLIIGAGFCALALWRCLRERALLRGFVVHASIATALGASYFAWRYSYFGQLLPLPLYVKSRGTERLLGLAFNRDWLTSPAGPVPLIVLGALQVVVLLRVSGRRSRIAAALAGALPGLLLFIALAFAHQSQNVDFRFQAPIFTLWFASSLALAIEASASVNRPLIGGLCIMLAAAALVPAVLAGKAALWSVDYLDTLAARIGAPLDDASIALTEAGRISYWTDGTVHDLVGLNDVHSAKQPATAAYVQSLAPDFVMYHQAGTLDLTRSRALAGSFARDEVVQIDGSSLRRAVRKRLARALRDDLESYDRKVRPTQVAALALTRFLIGAPGFEVFAVKYYGAFHHVYAIRTAGPHAAALRDALLTAHQAPYRSYAALKSFPRNTLPCRAIERLAWLVGPVSIGLPQPPDCELNELRAPLPAPAERRLY